MRRFSEPIPREQLRTLVINPEAAGEVAKKSELDGKSCQTAEAAVGSHSEPDNQQEPLPKLTEQKQDLEETKVEVGAAHLSDTNPQGFRTPYPPTPFQEKHMMESLDVPAVDDQQPVLFFNMLN